MKIAAFFIALLTFSTLNAQLDQVKFKEAAFENGMMYPIAVVLGDKTVEDNINKHLQSQIQDLKDADFCIGQYGFVQKGAHLQVHIFCNCIDFDESQNRYFLYNSQSGDNVSYSDLLNPKKIKITTTFLINKAKTTNNISDADIQSIQEKNLDAFKIIFKREGMDLWLKSEYWGEKPLFIAWGEMKEMMKYSFI
ncbi:MAG TPA: hypothetical protein EYG86_01540 [Crocinitomicaceae bacterium]|nr:hypothetical protein [Crocinitomicaceae bacterium]